MVLFLRGKTLSVMNLIILKIDTIVSGQVSWVRSDDSIIVMIV